MNLTQMFSKKTNLKYFQFRVIFESFFIGVLFALFSYLKRRWCSEKLFSRFSLLRNSLTKFTKDCTRSKIRKKKTCSHVYKPSPSSFDFDWIINKLWERCKHNAEREGRKKGVFSPREAETGMMYFICIMLQRLWSSFKIETLPR